MKPNQNTNIDFNYMIQILQSGLIKFQIIIILFMIHYAACSILFMLHFRKVNRYVLWIGIASLLMPFIFLFFALISLKVFFLFYITASTPIISLVLAIVFYIKYSDQDNLEKKGFLEPSSIGVEEDD